VLQPVSRRLEWRERWFGEQTRARVRLGARRHWIFLVVLGVGALVRIVTQVAYRPALLFIDSFGYLENLHDLSPRQAQPVGYILLLLRPVLTVGTLAAVAAVQHLLGLAMGTAIYAVLVRLGCRRWIGVLAAAPVLLDAYQLQIEQNIMSEALFEALVLAAVVLLLWKRPTYPTLAIAGALFGLSMTVRPVGGVLVIPGVAFALIAGTAGRARLFRAATLALAFAVPVGAYAAYYRVETSRIGFNRGDALLFYGRAATIVDCRGLDLPDYERPLCPREPLGERRGVNDYAHHSPYPGRVVPPPGKNRDTVLRDFARRVFIHQPWDLAKHVATDFGKGFSWPRQTFAGDATIDRWQFQREYPTFGDDDPAAAIRKQGGGKPSVVEPLAAFLRGYQLSVGYTPGPVLGLAFVAGLLAMFGVGRARRSGLRAACALPTLCGLSVLFAADLFHFSWRYQLPALVLAPLAGALGVTALTGWVTEARPRSTPVARPPSAPDSSSGAS
jgi:hypothetical protein